jgi:hypothetical protein
MENLVSRFLAFVALGQPLTKESKFLYLSPIITAVRLHHPVSIQVTNEIVRLRKQYEEFKENPYVNEELRKANKRLEKARKKFYGAKPKKQQKVKANLDRALSKYNTAVDRHRETLVNIKDSIEGLREELKKISSEYVKDIFRTKTFDEFVSSLNDILTILRQQTIWTLNQRPTKGTLILRYAFERLENVPREERIAAALLIGTEMNLMREEVQSVIVAKASENISRMAYFIQKWLSMTDPSPTSLEDKYAERSQAMELMTDPTYAKKELVDRVSENPSWFRKHYDFYQSEINRIEPIVLSLGSDIWRLRRRGGKNPLTAEYFQYLRRLDPNRLTVQHRIRMIATANNKDLTALYSQYISHPEIPLAEEDRGIMIQTCIEIRQKFDRPEVRDILTTVMTKVISVTDGSTFDNIQAMTIDRFLEWLDITLNQLDSARPFAANLLRADTKDYDTGLADAIWFVNPFTITVMFEIGILPRQSGPHYIGRVGCIRYESAENKDDSCIFDALTIHEPSPSVDELKQIMETNGTLVDILKIIKSVPVTLLEKDPYEVIYTTAARTDREGLNVACEIVLFKDGDHVGRVIAVTQVPQPKKSRYYTYNDWILKDSGSALKALGNIETKKRTIVGSIHNYKGQLKVALVNLEEETIIEGSSKFEMPSYEEFIKKADEYILVTKLRGVYYRIVDAKLPDQRIYYDLLLEPADKLEGDRWVLLVPKSYKYVESRRSANVTEDDLDPSRENIYFKSGDELYKVLDQRKYPVGPSLLKVKEEPIILAYDFETTNVKGQTKRDATIAILACATYKLGDKWEELIFEGEGCENQLREAIMKLGETRKIVCYAFNGATFDAHIMLSALANDKEFGKRTGEAQKAIRKINIHKINANENKASGYSGNASIVQSGPKILDLKYKNVVFRDIKRFFAGGSLESLTKTYFGITLKTQWDHIKTQQMFDSCANVAEGFEKLKQADVVEYSPSYKPGDTNDLMPKKAEPKNAYEAFRTYCLNDCWACLALVNRTVAMFSEITDGKMNVHECMTLPQMVYGYFKKAMKIKPYVTEDDEVNKFMRDSIVAGRSQIFSTAPLGVTEQPVSYVDIVSMYPFVMMQCPFPSKGSIKWVNEYVPGKLGFYEIEITKQSFPVIFPLKGSISGLGGHHWDYKGNFRINVPSVLLVDFWEFGGECKVIRGFYFENHERGILTEAMNMFREIKQNQDKLMMAKDPKANGQIREIAKLVMNSLGGKFVQRAVLESKTIIRKHEDREKFCQLSKAKSKVMLPLTKDEPSVVREHVGIDKPTIVHEIFEKKKNNQKSLALGIFIYAWSQHHIYHALLKRTEAAGSSFAMETDSIQHNYKKYEDYCEFQGIENPYDIPPPVLKDPIFDNSDVTKCPNLLIDKPLGYFYCPKRAAKYAKDHGTPFIPQERKCGLATDFGDFTEELDNPFGVSLCAYIAKKLYTVGPMKGEQKFVCKGVGKHTKSANGIIDRTQTEAEVLKSADVLNLDFYKKLANGYGVDVADRRFQCSLSLLAKDGTSLHSSLDMRHIAPRSEFFLQVRGDKNTKYEEDFPYAKPRGKKLVSVKYMGEVWDAERLSSFKKLLEEVETPVGATVEFEGKNVYVSQSVIKYLKRV